MRVSPNDFHQVLAAEVVSTFGSMLSRLALPWLAALALLATPLQMGWLLAADVAAAAAGSLVLGTLVDRCPKRAAMLASDLLRAGVLGSLAWLAWRDALTMPLLAVAAGANGLLTAAFELARSAWMARSGTPESLPVRNAQLSAGGSLAETAAFALGGWLYQGLGAVASLAVDALSYAVSACCLRGVREARAGADNIGLEGLGHREAGAAPAPRRAFRAEMWRGLEALAASPALRALAGIEVLTALGISVAGTSYMIFVSRDIGFGTGSLGLIFAIGGLGSLAGAALAPWLGRRIGGGRAMSAGLAVLALGALCIPLVPGATWAGAGLLIAHQVIADGGHTLYLVHDRTMRQTTVSAEFLARVDGGIRTLGQIATLIGAVGGGALATRTGARGALLLTVALFGGAALLAHLRLARRTSASAKRRIGCGASRKEKPVITETMSIPRRFNGPPRSGNGGYVCGRLAQYLSGPVTVRLRVPPPLEQALKVEASDDEARLLDAETLVAHARRVELEVAPPAAPTFARAEVASRSYVGFVRHLLPTCFVCGPQRAVGDGMRIFPGRTGDESVLAAPWVPDVSLANGAGRVSPEFLWAALDCAGAFAVMPAGTEPILLGELSARLDSDILVGEKCVVVAWPLGSEGRKRYAGTAIYSQSGAPVAVARATWIEIPAAQGPSIPQGERC